MKVLAPLVDRGVRPGGRMPDLKQESLKIV